MATWSTDFDSAVIINNTIMPNSYNISIKFDSLAENDYNVAIFIRRIKTFFELLHGTTIIGTDEKNYQLLIDNLEADWLTIPGIPYDALIAEMLHAKLTEFSEGNIDIKEVSVTSVLSGNVTLEYKSEFPYSEIEAKNPTEENQPWYYINDISTSFKTEEDTSWKHFNLDYESNQPIIVASKRMGLKIIDGGRPKGF